jgi:DNA-binding NtrC family response regulator
VPVDAAGRLIIRYAGQWTDGAIPSLSFVHVWDAIAEGREAELREQFAGKLVVLVHAALGSDKRRTPYEVSAPGGFILANVVNTILTEQGVREASPVTVWGLALGLSLGAAAAIAVMPVWLGVLAAGTLGMGYGVVAFLAMPFAGLVLPVLAPLAALAAAVLLTLAWTTRQAVDQVSRLEQDQLALHRALATKQELLAQQEARADRLDDEVAAATAEVAAGADRQTGFERTIAGLHQDLAAAQREEAATRQTLKGLESQLAALTVAQPVRATFPSEELSQLQLECAGYGILTRDPAVLRCWKDLKRAARSQTPIMILGEAGTGKELFAQATHTFSDRASQPFVPVNMAAVPPDLFESELFGHLRGSFTGAVRDHEGFFLQAHKGTLFLDEIGDLRLDLQAKLLRVLQEGVVMRVGDRKPMPVDVRVVSATNRNLLKGIAEGWFREDLYYRVHGIELRLPPLRERQGDVPLLAHRFVEQLVKQDGRSSMSLTQGALERLARWPWKGNIRELKRCVENAVVLAEGARITEDDLRLDSPGAESDPAAPGADAGVSADGGDDPKKSDVVLIRLLREHSFDLQATAATLGWDRSTVMQRLKGMCFQAWVQAQGDARVAAASLAGDPGLTRLVAVKLSEYVEHLQKISATFPSEETAIAGCKKRLKNLPDRYFSAVEAIVRQTSYESLGHGGASAGQ